MKTKILMNWKNEYEWSLTWITMDYGCVENDEFGKFVENLNLHNEFLSKNCKQKWLTNFVVVI